jgi:drug/metabolite transporter (DMT)-like permease
MTWQIILTISVFSISLSYLFQRRLAEKSKINPITLAIGFQLIVGIIIGIFAFIHGFHIPDLSPILLNLFLMVFLNSVGNITRFSSLKYIELSEFMILFQISVVTTVVISILFLKDKFLPINILGLVFVLSGAILVSWKSQKFALSKGEIFALLSGVCLGAEMANDAFIVRGFDVPTYLFFALMIPGTITWMFYFRKTKDLKNLFQKSQIKVFGAATIFYAISVVAVFLSYQIGRNMARISSIYASSIILTVILAIIFLKERKKLPIKIIAAILGTIGVILLG